MKLRSLILFCLFACTTPLSSMQKLSNEYRISFGDGDNIPSITEYFSFACPHCIALFQEDFSKIQDSLIDSGKIRFEFHPIPVDINTVQAMVCMEKLDEVEKRAFLCAVLGLAEEDAELNTQLMMKAMEILRKPIPELNQKEYLMASHAFQEAFLFLKQEDRIEAIPSISVDGIFYPEDVPTLDVLQKILKNKGGSSE